MHTGHLKNKIIKITYFFQSSIQMTSIQMGVRYSDHHSDTSQIFKWWSKYQTKFSMVLKYRTI